MLNSILVAIKVSLANREGRVGKMLLVVVMVLVV